MTIYPDEGKVLIEEELACMPLCKSVLPISLKQT